MLFPNVSAGSALISQAAAMIQELAGVSPALGAAFVGLLALANTVGRVLWTWLSEIVGSRTVFVGMFLIQTPALFLCQANMTGVALAMLAILVLLCYGGGFGTMAAIAAGYFGARFVGMTFGLLMTACGVGGVVGPLLIASVRQMNDGYAGALAVLAVGMQVGAAIALVLRPPQPRPPRVARASRFPGTAYPSGPVRDA